MLYTVSRWVANKPKVRLLRKGSCRVDFVVREVGLADPFLDTSVWLGKRTETDKGATTVSSDSFY